MYLDLEPYVQSIREKIANKDLNFTENERYVLNIHDGLRHFFYDALKAEPKLFTKELLKTVDSFDNFEEEIIENSNLLIQYAKAVIENGDYSAVVGVREYVSEEEAQEVLDFFLESISNKSDIILDDDTIEFLLDRGKTEIIQHLGSCEIKSQSLIEKFKEYFRTKDTVPDFLADNYKALGFDYSKYSVVGLLKIFNSMASTISYETSDSYYAARQKLYQMICDKIFSGASFDINMFKANLSRTFIGFDQGNKRNLVEALVKKCGINSTIISLVSDFQDYEDFILQNINEHTQLGRSNVYQDSLKKNKKILEKLIEFKHLEAASYFFNFADYIPMIIQKIKSGELDVVIEDEECFKQYPELLEVLLEHNMINSLKFYKSDFYNNQRLIEVVLKAIRDGQEVSLDEWCYSIANFLDTIIQSRNFATLKKTDLSQLKNAVLSENSIDILIEELKGNLILADEILRNARSLIFQNKRVLRFYLQLHGHFIEKVLNVINHEEALSHLYNEEVFDLIKVYYAEKYSLNLKHLEIMSTKFGMNIIRYLDNDNIHKLVNLSDEEFSNFIALFPEEKMRLSDIANIYDSIMQYKFSKEHPGVVNIFADIMHSLEDNSNIYIKKLEELYSVLGDKFYAKFKEVYPELTDGFKSDPKNFLLETINKIQSKSVDSDKYVEILHFITNYYIANKREKFREECNMYTEKSLAIPYDLDENDLEKKLVEMWLRDTFQKKMIILKLIERGLDRVLANKCILYFLSQKDKSSPSKDVEVRILDDTKILFSMDEVKQIKQYLRELNLISKESVKDLPNKAILAQKLDAQGLVKRVYRVPENVPDVYQLLTGMNGDALKHTLEHPEAYRSLLQIMSKYRIHYLPSGFKELLESENIGISGDYGNLSGFIAYYDRIYEAEKSRLESQGKSADNISLKPADIFIYGEVYTRVSSVYSQVLGSQDASLIKSNPGRNQATKKTSGNTRLNEAVERTISNFRRMSVTIPTFAENIPLERGKTMHAVVGNFTNPANMTHGERTGACMRIGGLGESLFQFCLDNENGFHIRFENPQTGEYISRVSGFRNGNTVFLNELRHSCNSEEYSDEDVVAACRGVAELLIEKSKNSSCPIENVVVHTAYAVDSSKYSKTNLGVSGIKIGLPAFYSDVSSTAHVLATTATDSPFVPIDFDKSKVPTYLPAREKAKATADIVEFSGLANRIVGVKMLLDGRELGEVEPMMIEDNFVYGIASQDWYVYVGADCIVHEGIIGIDSRANEELETARKIIEEMIPRIEKEQSYQY